MELVEYKKLKAKIFKEVKLDIESKVAQDKETYKDKIVNSRDRFNYTTRHHESRRDWELTLDLSCNITDLRKELKEEKLKYDSFDEEMDKIRYKKWTVWFDKATYNKYYSYYTIYEPDKLTIKSEQMHAFIKYFWTNILKSKKYMYVNTNILKTFEKWDITFEQLLLLHLR